MLESKNDVSFFVPADASEMEARVLNFGGCLHYVRRFLHNIRLWGKAVVGQSGEGRRQAREAEFGDRENHNGDATLTISVFARRTLVHSLCLSLSATQVNARSLEASWLALSPPPLPSSFTGLRSFLPRSFDRAKQTNRENASKVTARSTSQTTRVRL